MNRKKLIMFGIPILAVALVTAYIFIAFVKVDATVSEALSTSTIEIDLSGFPGETITEDITIDNLASVPLDALLTWEEKKNSYLLGNLSGTCPGTNCEERITIEAVDTEVTTLDSLETISWDADVLAGYLPHVDVFLDNGEVLVFEYAKAQPVCDNAPYPTGELNTFDDKGIVDDTAKAWLNGPIPGPCGDPTFDVIHKSLGEWKTIYPTANVLRFELEVDNWISPSSSEVSDILINGETTSATGVLYSTNLPQTIVLSPLGTTTFSVDFTYDGSSPVGIVGGRVIIERV